MGRPNWIVSLTKTRLAPTPSGYLHAGNALDFLITQKLARANDGSILLRIDDLDVDRARPEFIADIFDSLDWLGIAWDEGPRDALEFARDWSQTKRIDRYMEPALALREDGQLYACTCSRAQLATCVCRNRGLPFDTPDTAWRLRVPWPCPVIMNTWPSGSRMIDLHEVMRDPVLRQRNGSPAYQNASLADDVDHGINLIVRGEDLLPSTACQLHVAELLGLHAFQQVRFVHHPLITDANGAKLSKSQGASSLNAMRTAGLSSDPLHARAEAMIAQLKDQGL